jgi:hypothetical protein
MARKYPYFQKEAVSPHGAINYICNYIVGYTCATLGSSKEDIHVCIKTLPLFRLDHEMGSMKLE